MKREAGFTASHSAAITEQAIVPDSTKHPFVRIAEEMGKLVVEKNAAYGSAYITSATFLELLFPNGVHPTRYTDMLLMVRMFDKMMRLATRKDAFGESPWRDMNGYTLLGIHKDERFEKGPAKTECPQPGERIII